MLSDGIYKFKKYLEIYLSGFETLAHPTYSRSMEADDIVKHSGAKYKIGFEGDYTNMPENIKKEL